MKIYCKEPASKDALNKLLKYHTLTKDHKEADAFIIRNIEVDKKMIDEAINLKLIIEYGTGYNNIDYKYATSKGIVVANCPYLNINAVSEETIMMALGLSRNLLKSLKTKELGSISVMGYEIRNKTVGFIGLGHISINTAKILKDAFNCNILGYNRTKKNIPYINEVELDYLLNNSDYIILGLALNNETYHFINLDIFNKMKKNPYLINPARGGLIDNDALLYALKNNIIKGYATDTFDPEPINDDNEILNYNTIILPHVGANTKEALDIVGFSVVDKIIDFFNGRKIDNIIK